MSTDAPRRLLADLRRMASTGRHSFTGAPIGAALASRLPRLITDIAELLDARRRAGDHAHG